MSEQTNLNFKKKLGIFRNSDIRKYIDLLDADKDHQRITQLITGFEFPFDMIRALEVALFRTFCSPPVTKVLAATREMERHGQKRYDDTALIIAEIMENGYDSPRGKAAIERMNFIHSHFRIENRDYLYVLSTFIFDPIMWMEKFAYRPMTTKEQKALFLFFREVGKRMHIQNIPESLEDFRCFADEYEEEYFVFDKNNRLIGDVNVEVVKAWLPPFLRFAVKPSVRAMFDKRMLDALGYDPAPAWLGTALRAVLALRAAVLKIIHVHPAPYYYTKSKVPTYPEGYKIEELGPDRMRQGKPYS